MSKYLLLLALFAVDAGTLRWSRPEYAGVLAVLNYHSIHLYVRNAGEDWSTAMKQAPGELNFPWLPQAEAIAFSPDGRSLLIGGEQRPSPLLMYRAIP
jgi:hypothetical protein